MVSSQKKKKKKKILTWCPLVATQHTYIHIREFLPRAPVALQNIQAEPQQIYTHLVEMELIAPVVFGQQVTEWKQGTLETMK
jgi:hypothetical protein